MDCPSTPGAPLLALTCRQARQTSYPETANGFPSNGPPDTDLRPPSGLSPSMTLLPATLVDETKQPRASRPRRSPPHRARQEDHRYHEPVRLPARQRSRPSRRHAARGLPSRHPETRGGSTRASPPPFHADAADQARATYTPD